MKKIILVLIGSALLLSGCTYAKDTMTQSPKIDWALPASIETDTPIDMKILIQSDNTGMPKVTSLVLKEQGKTEIKEVPFDQDDDGNIEIQTTFEGEGIYHLQAKIEVGSQTIQPTRQIVVGEVVNGGEKQEEAKEEGHSSHH